MNLIGFTGFAGCGKDTAAQALDGWQRVSFAEPLRQMLLTLDPWISTGLRLQEAVRLFGWDDAKRKFSEVRRLLQVFGTEVIRDHVDQNYWVYLAEASICGAFAAGRNVVITDVRFPNEVAMVHLHGGKVIRIARVSCADYHWHSSEGQFLAADRVINNDGTIQELHEKVLEAVEELSCTEAA